MSEESVREVAKRSGNFCTRLLQTSRRRRRRFAALTRARSQALVTTVNDWQSFLGAVMSMSK